MRVAIIGAGDGGRITARWLSEFQKDFSIVGFLDDNPDLKGKRINDINVIGTTRNIDRKKIDAVAMTIGYKNMRTRRDIFERARLSGVKIINVIHPDAQIDATATLGCGLFIFPAVVINPYCRLADNIIIFTAATIDHDCIVGENVYISPGVNLGGHVRIKEDTFIGIGAKVIDGVTIGKNAVIGAGAVILKDVPDNAVVVGVPGKIIKYNDEKEK